MRAILRCAALAILFVPLLAAKRPLNHGDYDSWRHIQNQQLSNDGKYLAYALFPQQGDGELIVINLATGKEFHQPIGELPPPPRPNFAVPQPEDAPPPTPGIAVKFSSDSRFLVFTGFAPRAEVEKAKREKLKPEEMPQGGMGIVNLASGEAFRAPRVKSFQLADDAPGYVAYLQSPEKPVKKSDAGELVLRRLVDGSERKFADVSEYLFTRDGKNLVYVAETEGVYSLTPDDNSTKTLLTGKGPFEKLAFDEDQTRFAFLSKDSLYTWQRKAAQANRLNIELPEGWVISDKATVSISKGGGKIFLGTAPAPPPEKQADDTPPDERVSVDLWSWRDDYIQPMQKVRAGVERNRSYRAVYDIASNKFTQLADPSMYEVIPSDDGLYGIGSDDRAYRRMQEYDTDYEDAYLVNISDGERKLIAAKHYGHLSWSPDGKYIIYFSGKDWITISVPDCAEINLTSKIKQSFGREDYDSPGIAPPYGFAAWTKDGKYVLIYDRFDIWQCRPDGSSAVNLTQNVGRKQHLIFRVVRFDYGEPSSRWLDPAQPLLLRAENEETRESGFYRSNLAKLGPPQKLLMEAKNFAVPIKAHNANVYVTASSTFSEYPDLLVTDGSFQSFHKVTDANPQKADLLWGTSELIHFQSANGKDLAGILYKPENFDPKKKYPLLVYIYERLSQNVYNFVEPRPSHTINPSYYVSNGYLVLEPDITYRIGYPGESALDCVLPAIQSVVDDGFVNEKAIGIQGHSWGGYQISYMLTRTNRFRAAAVGAPVADMISAYDAIRWGPGRPRQFQYEHAQSRIGGTIWEYPLRYIENSPIFAMDRVTTPVLMIHNDADDAVPWYQGIEMFLALRRLNKEAYMFTYNGEPHGLRRRANQRDYTIRLQEFFDYYLKAAEKPEWMQHGVPYIEKQGVTATDTDY